MFSLASLSFLTPWALAALLTVPALWWLLRIMPPRPSVLKIPTYFVLEKIETSIKSVSSMPLWLLILRALLLTLFILAMAQPIFQMSNTLPGDAKGAVVVVVDNGWASTNRWEMRQQKIKDYLTQLQHANRNVVFIPTAPSARDGKIHIEGPMTARDAEKWIDQLEPLPWPTDHEVVTEMLRDKNVKLSATYGLYISDGVMRSARSIENMLAALKNKTGDIRVVTDENVNQPYVLRYQNAKFGKITFEVERLQSTKMDEEISLVAYAKSGQVLDQFIFEFPSNERRIVVEWPILENLQNKIARITLRGSMEETAASIFWTDSQWQQHAVGVLADPERKTNQSFLNEVYYLKKALENRGQLQVDQAEKLFENDLSVVLWPDSATLTAAEKVAVLDWVEGGGFLIRFAGSHLAAAPDDALLPVRLRFGQRAMQGAMTWETPLTLAPIGENSPLYGLNVPVDITVSRQVLAEPVPETFEHTWLQLKDGTPLITGSAKGKGTIVLVHTSAGPDWSNFAYSGLYVEILQRMISLSNGITHYKVKNILPQYMVMDAKGKLSAPQENTLQGSIDPKTGFSPSPLTPPGLYGDAQYYSVFNLGESLPPMLSLNTMKLSETVETYTLSGEKTFKETLLKIVVFLLLLDTVLTLWLRGIIVLPQRFKTTISAVIVAVVFITTPAMAHVPTSAELASGIYLAYIETGNSDIDQTSRNGLKGLQDVVSIRTNIHVDGVVGVNPEKDPLIFYPILYWPMTSEQKMLSPEAARNLRNYMAHGGMILFDTRDQKFANDNGDIHSATIGTRQLRALTSDIPIAELMAVEEGHILTKSFYLLSSFPGVYAGGKLWVEKEPSDRHDSVTSVVIGGNSWAAAWSQNQSDRARYIVQGGEETREMAYRFGINLLMVATAGNYKADQIHIPHILERLGK